MSSSQSSTHITQSSASTAAGPTTTSKLISHPSGKRHVLLISFAAEGALPILQRVSRNSQLEEEWAVEVPNTYMLPWITPADEPNEQTAESGRAALEFIQKWTEASHPSKNYAAFFELDKTLDWPEPTASFSEFEKFIEDYVSNVQQALCRRVADEVAKSMENNDFFTYSVVDEPEFTFRGGLIPPGRIRPMDLEEYQSQISILAEDQQAWKAAHSVPFHQLCLSHQAYKIQVACMPNPMASGIPATQFIRSLATQLAILTNFLKKWPKVLTLRMKRLRSNTFRPIGTRACLAWQTVVLASTVMLKISRTSTNGLQRHCNLVIEKPRAKSAKHLRAPV